LVSSQRLCCGAYRVAQRQNRQLAPVIPKVKLKTKERPNMRMMLKIVIPTEAGNHAIKDGSLPKIFEATMSKLNPKLLIS
jgi:hypothetical protein